MTKCWLPRIIWPISIKSVVSSEAVNWRLKEALLLGGRKGRSVSGTVFAAIEFYLVRSVALEWHGVRVKRKVTTPIRSLLNGYALAE